ncbi:hypothetical protein [Oceanihabitans sp. IOP_32]|uniref:hypothetical protein n=1 Tax=Oceanihabitans sp. IOP_32 TaxID=2529032 RepID=UPI00129380A3|nr:hypothetical protein [Oceanihabitans sp. IOP_32]
MENNKNLQIIDTMNKAFAAGDMPTVLGNINPNIEWNEAKVTDMRMASHIEGQILF